MPSIPGWGAVISGSTASCQAENAYAAVTPMETSVSIVEERCRALMAAARWKGQAPQVTTGSARIPAAQPQLANWNAGTIELRNTGTVRMAATIRRGRSLAAAADAGWSTAA